MKKNSREFSRNENLAGLCSRALVICKENEFVFMEAKVTVYEGVHCTTDNIKLNILLLFFLIFPQKQK